MPRYNSLDQVPPEIKRELEKYISNLGGSTFLIRNLPPEIAGAVVVRYSRAPTGLCLTLANEFLDENGQPSQKKGTDVINRVVNQFSDDSCQEFASVLVGLEGISNLLTKQIEDRRIGGSPIEQSSRYVVYDQKDEQGRWRYLRPRELTDPLLSASYECVNDTCFEVYREAVKRLKEHFKTQFPREEYSIRIERDGKEQDFYEKDLATDDERQAFNNAYNFTIRCAALDVARCVLPSSTLTQMGILGNARYYTNLLSFLKSQTLAEPRSRAADLESELNKEIPTFIRRNKANYAWQQRDEVMRKLANELFAEITPDKDSVTFVRPGYYFDEVIASILFPYTDISLKQIRTHLSGMGEYNKLVILDKYIGRRSERRDRSGRALEAGYPITFDIVGTFAEYRDLERHRMLTQQRQRLGTHLGFYVPEEISMVGLEKEVIEAADRMSGLNSDLRKAGLDEVAQYATCFNHKIRFNLGMNLREAQHLIELRTGPKGHFGYRAICQEMARQIISAYPFAAQALTFTDYSDPGNKIARAKEQARIAGKNLKAGIDGGIDL